jgi:hypothetical protein
MRFVIKSSNIAIDLLVNETSNAEQNVTKAGMEAKLFFFSMASPGL